MIVITWHNQTVYGVGTNAADSLNDAQSNGGLPELSKETPMIEVKLTYHDNIDFWEVVDMDAVSIEQLVKERGM